MVEVFFSKNNDVFEIKTTKSDPWFATYLKSYKFNRRNSHWQRKSFGDEFSIIQAVEEICQIKKFDIIYDDNVKNIKKKIEQIHNDYKYFSRLGNKIKLTRDINLPEFKFKTDLNLLNFQKLSIKHMISIPNSANFSIPGTGKTIMTLVAFHHLKNAKKVDQLWVIGPIPSFKAWEDEYEILFNKNKNGHVIRHHGSNRSLNRLKNYDLVITSYNTAANDLELIRKYWKKNNKKVFLVLDESHHIKSIQKNASSGEHTFSAAMINLGKSAERRCILTGTPVPHDLEDLWSQITFLWPHNEPLGNRSGYLELLKDFDREERIKNMINFMWTRVTNKELQNNMPKRYFPEPIDVKMDPEQEDIYRIIESQFVTEMPDGADKEKIKEWKKAKTIRLLQAVTNPKLIIENDEDFKFKKLEINTDSDKSVINIISEYQNKIPPKIEAVAEKARELIAKRKNVLIFTVFRGNVAQLKNLLKDTNPLIVTGQFASEIREQTYEKFKNWNFSTGKGKILIATMGSIAESVSLHKNKRNEPVCQDVIYLEKNFNGGQYMQSLYRVYRIGSNKKLPITYYSFHSILLNKDETLDCIISTKLNERLEQLYSMLDDEFITEPLSLEENSDEYEEKIDEFYGMNETGDDIAEAVEKLAASRKSNGNVC